MKFAAQVGGLPRVRGGRVFVVEGPFRVNKRREGRSGGVLRHMVTREILRIWVSEMKGVVADGQ